MAGWNPIETAPKDGSPILVYPSTWRDQTASVARWDADAYAKTPRPFWWRSDASVSRARAMPPTHWMELPAAPAE